MISWKCSRSSKKRRMEDRDVSSYEGHSSPSGQLSTTLHDTVLCQEFSMLPTVLNSALPGGDHPAAGLVTGIARPDKLLQPRALGQDWALSPPSCMDGHRAPPRAVYATAPPPDPGTPHARAGVLRRARACCRPPSRAGPPRRARAWARA